MMTLYDDVVEIFALPNLNSGIVRFIIGGHARFIGTTFFKINQTRPYIGTNGLSREALWASFY